ncbi:MAG: IS630 family transposase [Patescibacteria group bacterium]
MKRYLIQLTDDERAGLEALIGRGRVRADRAKRARIVLLADSGLTDEEIVDELGVGVATVERTRRACVMAGLVAAVERKPQARLHACKLDGAAEAQLVHLACSTPPAGRARWTLRLLASQLVLLEVVESISHETVRQTLKKNELKPWLTRRFCIPPKENASFVAAMEDVLDVYQRPYDPEHPVVCLDETSKQLVEHTRVPLAAQPGQVACEDDEYKRCGVANVFMAVEPIVGTCVAQVSERRTCDDFARFVRQLCDDTYRNAESIVLVMDNLSTHSVASLYGAFEPAEARRLAQKLEIHFTPKHGSWLNMAEIELSILSRQCLDRRIPNIAELTTEVAAWNVRHNADPAPIRWHFTNADARVKLLRLYPSRGA